MIPIEIVAGSTDEAMGYGNATGKLAEALQRAGAQVSVVPQVRGPFERAEVVEASPRAREAIRICFNVAPMWRWGEARWRVGLTMWESSKLPENIPYTPHRSRYKRKHGFTAGETFYVSWRDYANTADLVVVPCEHNRQMFRAEGTARPIAVMPLGLDAAQWRPLARPTEKATYMFLMHGELSQRKGFDLAYTAFWRAFGHDPTVRLVFKTRGMTLYGNPEIKGANAPWRFRDPNITLLRGDWRIEGQGNGPGPSGGLLRLMQMADCYVHPSRGEGWGLTPREAVATGLPAILPRHTGFDVPDLDEWAYPLERITLQPAHYLVWTGCGDFYEPDVDELAERMVWCRAHRAEALVFGARASRVVRAQTWDTSAQILLAALCERFGFAPGDLKESQVESRTWDLGLRT